MSDFKSKTFKFSDTDGNRIFRDFLEADDVEIIVNEVFDGNMYMDNNDMLAQMNNIIHLIGIFFPSLPQLFPGKTDKLKLLKKLERNINELIELIPILINQYGYEALRYFDCINPKTKKNNTKEVLFSISEGCRMIAPHFEKAVNKVEESPGKKTGNNSKQAIDILINYLIPIYESASNKKAYENIHQNRSTGSLRYNGQLYNFIFRVLRIINSRYAKLYPDKKDINPFKISFDENSIALGKRIEKNLKKKD